MGPAMEPTPLPILQAALATGRGVRRVPGLAAFLGCPVSAASGVVVLAWGLRPSATKAERVARKRRLPLWRLEDGFLRSLGLTDAPLSLVVDDRGIHYDATKPSRLEALVPRTLSPEETARAQALLRLWREARVSKYNAARDGAVDLPQPYVLVADQTWGDRSISHGLADAASFPRMLEAALSRHPECTIILKVHPQVMAGRRRGHFDLAAVARMPRVQVLGQDIHPAGLLAGAEAVYAVTSQIGFEGLLWGKPVHTFGMPFYAGWGLTTDALSAPSRRQPVPLENLVHAALVDYPRYLDPETGQRCSPEQAIAWMGHQRRMRERFPAEVHATGFSLWKKPIVRAYFAGSCVHFTSHPERLPAGATLVSWGRRPVAIPEGVHPVRLEDGFLRSVGLGVDLVRPLSWVMDRRGIYYDSTQPSDLEHLLQTTDFTPALRERAARLRERIVATGLTKYNDGEGTWSRPAAGGKVILVPGQVETDAAIRLGAPGLRTNLGLLRAVREANPGAHILYKPHPDVLAGLRKKGPDEDETRHWCNELIERAAMGDLLGAVDEVHVLTSLAGFEALLRGKPVTCYGQPFYSGWGLTTDIIPVARRTRRVTLDELVAATLILYPAYLSRRTGHFTTPEQALTELVEWRETSGKKLPVWRQAMRWILRLRAH